MKIGKKHIIIKKNINNIINDFELLFKNGIFKGEINEKYFNMQYEIPSRLAVSELKGELFEKNINSTLINIDIIFPNFHMVGIIVWLLVVIPKIFIPIIYEWKDKSIFANIFFLIFVFSFPIMDIIHFNYTLNNMLIDFNLYEEGFFNKYIN